VIRITVGNESATSHSHRPKTALVYPYQRVILTLSAVKGKDLQLLWGLSIAASSQLATTPLGTSRV
jgi:hypothetical protein